MGDLRRRISRRISQAHGIASTMPFRSWHPAIAEPELVAHSAWEGYLATHFNKEGLRVLELGSRNVTGANRRGRFANSEYIGFDFYDGENVDVVGDVHKLTSYIEPGSVDLVFSSAVLEHLHMPWVAAIEVQKVLRVGGHAFIETHFSYASHERPWHFFQFSDMGLRALFNDSLGFDLVVRR